MNFSSLRRFSPCLLVLAVALFAASRAPAQVTIYAIDYNSGNSQLYSINSSTWATTLIGTTGQYLEALAISPKGDLFATSTSGNLYKLDLTTAAATLVGDTGRSNIEALDFNGSTLLGVTFSGSPVTVFSIDTTNGTTTDLVTLSPAPNTTRSAAMWDGKLLIRSDGSPKTLSAVNLADGTVTSIGSLGGNNLYAMDFAPNGTLYALDDDGSVYSVNTSSGATTLLGDTGSQLWLGLTIQAIPEPSTYALLALGGGLLVLAARRRRRG